MTMNGLPFRGSLADSRGQGGDDWEDAGRGEGGEGELGQLEGEREGGRERERERGSASFFFSILII